MTAIAIVLAETYRTVISRIFYPVFPLTCAATSLDDCMAMMIDDRPTGRGWNGLPWHAWCTTAVAIYQSDISTDERLVLSAVAQRSPSHPTH